LQQQLIRIQADAAQLEEVGAKIADLQRKKQVQEDNYKYFANSLEEAQINEALGPGHVSGIDKIQQPSPPFRDFGAFHKKTLMMILGGLFCGLAWAFLIEFYFDRSIKRAVEVETKLHLPCFLSIPDLNRNTKLANAAIARRQIESGTEPSHTGTGSLIPTGGKIEVGTWQINHALDTHFDALRDRLVLYFESINLTRKPKLVAVTSTEDGSGVSTVAAGLAASLSETGDGRVLLVDMNRVNGAAQQFFNGKPSCKLDDALISDKRDQAMVRDNLYVVTEESNSDRLTRVLPKRFATLVPQLKTSDYDYIIFDMPPVTQTSVTTRLASFMDTVLLVIESEKTDRETVKQANELLTKSKTNIGAVLNKTRQYIPSRLSQDITSKL
jgi:Mrp family chromosome partitioning ATPase